MHTHWLNSYEACTCVRSIHNLADIALHLRTLCHSRARPWVNQNVIQPHYACICDLVDGAMEISYTIVRSQYHTLQ
jgi:hypothetical protein